MKIIINFATFQSSACSPPPPPPAPPPPAPPHPVNRSNVLPYSLASTPSSPRPRSCLCAPTFPVDRKQLSVSGIRRRHTGHTTPFLLQQPPPRSTTHLRRTSHPQHRFRPPTGKRVRDADSVALAIPPVLLRALQPKERRLWVHISRASEQNLHATTSRSMLQSGPF
jgi:hypothetical protein